MEGDLISRSLLLKEAEDWLCDSTDLRCFTNLIEIIPAVDAVEVVRCKDCMFYQPYEGEEHKGDCEELVGLESCVYEDDFCSYGCRMEE